MVKIMENPTKIDDLGGFPIIFWKHPYEGLGGTRKLHTAHSHSLDLKDFSGLLFDLGLEN